MTKPSAVKVGGIKTRHLKKYLTPPVSVQIDTGFLCRKFKGES